MLISRLQAPHLPQKDQILMIFQAEGLTPFEDVLPAGEEILDLRNPFDEVRVVAAGELLLDIAGNKLLLRAGDRIVIPSNTRHSKQNQGDEPCICICANKI